MADVTEWFDTAAGNDQGVPPDFAPEGGTVNADFNNIVREMQGSVRREFNSGGWFEYGDGSGPYSATFVSASQFDILGVDVTARYAPNTKVRITQGATVLFGIISASVVNVGDTRVTVILQTGSIANAAIDKVELGDLGGQSPTPVDFLIRDADRDTLVTVEQSPDDDAIVAIADGQQILRGTTQGLTAALQPSLRAYFSASDPAQDNATGAGARYLVLFPTVDKDIGGNFAPTFDTFTALIAGDYLVSVSLALQNINEQFTSLNFDIERSDGEMWRQAVAGAAGNWISGNMTDFPVQQTRIVPMSQGQTLQIFIGISGLAGNTVDLIGSDDRNRTELAVRLLG